MYSERLQILVTPQQRRRLQAESRRRGTSVAAIIRDAVDAELGGPVTREDRMRAVEEIRQMGGRAKFLTPEELNRIAQEAIEDRFDRLPHE
jgi:hypothetical protein